MSGKITSQEMSSTFLDSILRRNNGEGNYQTVEGGINIVTGAHDSYALTIGDSGTGAYGFKVKYFGSGSGNSNKIKLYTDGRHDSSGHDVEVFELQQDGIIMLKQPIRHNYKLMQKELEIFNAMGGY